MLCACGKAQIRYKAAQQCARCYESAKALADGYEMQVMPCEGGCGKRLHNMRYVVVPGVTQGHGPGMRWCCGCAMKYRPTDTKSPYRGPCVRCERPMMVGDLEPGFVQFWASGKCKRCYNWLIKHPDDREPQSQRGEQNNRTHLKDDDIRDIRKRFANGEFRKTIAQDYNIHVHTVSRIANRSRWAHVN